LVVFKILSPNSNRPFRFFPILGVVNSAKVFPPLSLPKKASTEAKPCHWGARIQALQV
jgi:hypothetical protein